MKIKPQFIALLQYIPEKDGGRKTPAMSGYRPTIKFPFYHGQFSGVQNFIGVENVFPGDTVKAEITLLSTEYFVGKLYEGLDFDFFEGGILIGHGVVTKVLDADFGQL